MLLLSYFQVCKEAEADLNLHNTEIFFVQWDIEVTTSISKDLQVGMQ